jgi:hypothetical protein
LLFFRNSKKINEGNCKINYFVETGIGLVTDIQKLEALMGEAIDHEIVELKVSSENNKEIYKMNLERSLIERIAEGEFM